VLNWPDHFNLAKELLEREGEVYQRTAVSKAYYAMFYNARGKLMISWEWDPPEDDSHHTYLWDKFENDAESRRIHIGELGHRLRRSRNRVDYEEDIDNFSNVIAVAMINAERLKSALESM
jgi:uncharacterized protein (UPF0332 family)